MGKTPLATAITLAIICAQSWAQPTTQPTFGDWAATPPMGWNSYDAFGDTVVEAEVVANARYMKDHLLSSGYKYVIVDFRWYDPDARGNDFRLNQDRAGAKLTADKYGRLQPALNRFPSAVDDRGFKPLADQIHEMGLKFGVHMMRGIPRQSVTAHTPIENTSFTAADAGDTKNICGWCPDMFGVRKNDAGQAWYDAMFRQYADWGLDFVKIDDLSLPYSAGEIEMIRRAIDYCGRPIVFSTSPGPTDPHRAEHIAANANMWRISSDFWDNWEKVEAQFDLLGQWKGIARPGHWPDADMIPFGRIAIRCVPGGVDHRSHLTFDEQKTLMTLWAIAPSPFMLGGNLPDTDEKTLALLTNQRVLAVNQDSLGRPGERVASFAGGREIWLKSLNDRAVAVGLFNRAAVRQTVYLRSDDVGLTGVYHAIDAWDGRDAGTLNGSGLPFALAPHGAVMLLLRL
jgi:alpha-galactosidase